MTGFALKILAIVCMFADHFSAVTGLWFFPLRYIGRLTMPIMCFLIGEGYRHTRDVKKYILRLFVFALVSEVFFDLTFYGVPVYWGHQNVFFTLAAGLAVIWAGERPTARTGQVSDKPAEGGSTWIFYTAAVGVAAEALRVDYGLYGIFMIVFMYRYRNDFKKLALSMVLLNLLYLGTEQMYSLAALVPIYFYNGRQGPKMKYFFYVFYPLHLFLLFLAVKYITV